MTDTRWGRWDLPLEYEPLESLAFCGNRLIGVQTPILIDGIPRILVGKGSPPRLWIYGAVADNRALKSDVKVVVEENLTTVVKAERTVAWLSHDPPAITKLDLRPLGVDIWGNQNELTAFGRVFSQNEFSGVGAMIAVTSRPAEPIPGGYAQMGPETESLVAEVLRKQGYEVEIPTSVREGADFYVKTDAGLWAIEVKAGRLGAGTVQNLVGAKYRHKADFAALLAFGPISPEALRLASDAGIVLLSGRDLSDFLEGKVLLDPSNLGRSTNLSSRQSELP